MIVQKNILLSEITPDPNQPRKFYDEAAMNELTDSVREKGVLQPILVRPNGKGYLLVCGERRFRAATAAFLKEIPAVIRELTDEGALELQIIENLQRKDVHPMEEAVAFKSLLEKGKDVKEIAARVGKNEYYVRQRLKLNELSKEWQKVFYENQITAVLALKISGYDNKTQKELWKDTGKESGKIEINNWYFNKMSGDISKASFDPTDTTLDKKAGPCTSCPFNSAVASLFPDASENPTCSKISCFKHKSDIHFDRALKSACEDPEIILVNTKYHNSEDDFTRKLAKEGHQILNVYSSMVSEPEKPVYDEDEHDPDDFDSEKDRRKQFEEDLWEYEQRLAQFKNKVAGGKLKKGFVVVGDDKGKIVYFEMSKTSTASKSSKATKEKEASGDLTVEDINEEIRRIQEREKRAKELDQEKVQQRISEAVKADKSVAKVPERCENIDRILARYLLSEHVSFNNRDKIKKALGIDLGVWSTGKGQSLWDKLSQLTDQQVTFLIRQIIVDKYKLSNPRTNDGYVFRRMAESLGTIPIEAFEIEQKEVAEKRAARVAARIKQLQEKKKELATPKKSAPKKAAKKK